MEWRREDSGFLLANSKGGRGYDIRYGMVKSGNGTVFDLIIEEVRYDAGVYECRVRLVNRTVLVQKQILIVQGRSGSFGDTARGLWMSSF